jgi:CheY-like chemotaxis protein
VSVLVVEDIALNQLLMRTLLDDFGFKCDIAANGKIGIEKLKTNSYDVVLMDLQMPEMNGFEATEYIRKELKLTIPIIALTADVTTADLEKCKAVGMDDYISKPVDERLLQSKIILCLTRAAFSNHGEKSDEHKKEEKATDLTYLIQRTKSDPLLIMEMISLFLGQTKPLLREIKESLEAKNWKALYAIVHKIIPSLSIVGIKPDYIALAKTLQENTRNEKNIAEIEKSVQSLTILLVKACEELEHELILINNPAS